MQAVDYPAQIMKLADARPLQPVIVAQTLKTNTIMASAFLAELKAKGKLRISAMKVGSSPLYYLPNRPEQLEQFVSSLNEKDQRTVTMLKAKKVVRDSELEPLMRVSARSLRDFARPLEATFQGKTEIFWKYFLYSDEEVTPLIRKILEENDGALSSTQKPALAKPQIAQKTAPPASGSTIKKHVPQSMPEEHSALKRKSRKTRPLAAQTKIDEHPEKPVAEAMAEAALEDPFLNTLVEFFGRQHIKVLEHARIKRKTEHDFILQIPTVVGQVLFFAKAKCKTRVLPADLTAAFVGGQLRKLPSLLISPGELSRTAVNLQRDLKAVTFRRLEP